MISIKKNSIRLPLRRVVDQSYDIVIGDGLNFIVRQIIELKLPVSNYQIISDHLTGRLYGNQLLALLRARNLAVTLWSFRGGEHSKIQAIKTRLEHNMLKHNCGRDTAIIALGGGVVGDMAGFVAATYMRGIPYIQVPTTLLAMVDSSIGGKTGIDTPQGKNMLGAFYQPVRVIINTEFLPTLPARHLTNGLIEALKMFLLFDPPALTLIEQFDLEKKIDIKQMREIIRRSVSLKARIISGDETEKGSRALLNFGHTIGHALERLSGYTILHGYAVGLGMLLEAQLSKQLGLLSQREYLMIESQLDSLGIRGKDLQKFSAGKIISATQWDKKASAGRVRYVLLKKIGQPYITKNSSSHFVADTAVQAALDYFFK